MTIPVRTPPILKFIPAAILLGGLGWTVIIWLFIETQPYEAGYRWLFFLALFLGVTGPMLPVVTFLNHRFPGSIPATQTVILRQATWVGLFASALAWLQIGRLTSVAIVLLFLIGLIVIEILFRIRERSRWRL